MDWTIQFDRRVSTDLQDVIMLQEEPISRQTSFRIGGHAKRMAFPHSAGELLKLLRIARFCEANPLVIGNGTNLLAPDEGLDRLVIGLSHGLNRIENGPEPNTIMAEAGVSLARAADFACKQGLSGLEFAHGIPGTVGGGVCMNAGAYGGEIKQVLSGAAVLFPEEEQARFLYAEAVDLSYRHSLLLEKPESVLLHAVFRLTPRDSNEIMETMRDLMQRRKASQPLEWPSAGSTFKRPEGYFAGKLIQDSGLRGFSVGGAQVSEKHCGFVINKDHATAADIAELMRRVSQCVEEKFGVALEPEVKRLGEF